MAKEFKEGYLENARLDAAYFLFVNETEEMERSVAFVRFLGVLAKAVCDGAIVPTPFVDVDNAFIASLDPENLKVGDKITLHQDVKLRMDTMTAADGSLWIPLFINDRAISQGETANIISPVRIQDILKIGLERKDVMGVVINPFGKALTFEKDFLERFLADYRDMVKKEPCQSTEGGN